MSNLFQRSNLDIIINELRQRPEKQLEFQTLLNEHFVKYVDLKTKHQQDIIDSYNSALQHTKQVIHQSIPLTMSACIILIKHCNDLGSLLADDAYNPKSSISSSIRTSELLKTQIKIYEQCVRIGFEIFSLIESGYDDAAISRWRTLDEYTVIANVLHKRNDNLLAERYIQHSKVFAYKALSKLQENTSEEFITEEINRERTLLLAKYGDSFKNDYGWYFEENESSAKKRYTFEDLATTYGTIATSNFRSSSHSDVHGTSARFQKGKRQKDKIGLINTLEIPIISLCSSIVDVSHIILSSFERHVGYSTLRTDLLHNYAEYLKLSVFNYYSNERHEIDPSYPIVLFDE